MSTPEFVESEINALDFDINIRISGKAKHRVQKCS